MLSFGDGAAVRYTTAETFTNHFVRALGSRSIDRFKQAYRNADVLLIDDVQFLASKAKTEEEFFHTFNALYETGRQLVLTCDRLPRQLVSVEERLRERFESGLVAVIKPPDHATRVAILRKRAALDRIPVTDVAVLELIADRITDNVRVLEGALIRIVAYHSLTQLPIDARARRDSPRRDPPTAATQSRLNVGRRHPERGRLLLRAGARAAHLLKPGRRRDLAAPGRDPPRPCAHRRLAERDRRGVRRTQPRHGPPRLQACDRAHGPRSTSCSRGRGTNDDHRIDAIMTDPLDRLVCSSHTPSFPLPAANRGVINTPHTPMTSNSNLRYSS